MKVKYLKRDDGHLFFWSEERAKKKNFTEVVIDDEPEEDVEEEPEQDEDGEPTVYPVKRRGGRPRKVSE